MGEDCCANHAKRRGYGIYTDKYYGQMERSSLRQMAIQRIIETCGSDGVLLKEELNFLNRSGNEVIANNHGLRAEIYELKNEISILNERIRLMLQASSIESVHTASMFPYESKYRKISE